MRDFITKKKIKHRKRYLCDTIYNLHQKFCKEFGCKIGLTAFQNLKSYYVVRLKASSRQTRICKVHPNFSYMYQKLYIHNVLMEKNVPKFMESITCDINDKKCMFNEHVACRNVKFKFPTVLTLQKPFTTNTGNRRKLKE